MRHQVAAEVRAEMARQRLSGRALAARLGWPQNRLSRRLAGDIPFTVDDLAAIAALLEVPVTRFFATPSGATSGVISLPSSARHLWAMAA
jgi:transcriptional regulator with XRE-family HTH domain